MRVFFAIEFEDEIKEYLFSIKEEVRQLSSGGNFTSKENFHLTLRFIGEQSQSQTEKLIAALHDTAANMPTFEVVLDKLGKFDKKNRKIIWIGLQKSEKLEVLYNQLESVLAKIGYMKEDREFSPHITVAREVRIDSFEELANKKTVKNLAIKVKSISLMESKRVDNKLCYVPVASVGFASV